MLRAFCHWKWVFNWSQKLKNYFPKPWKSILAYFSYENIPMVCHKLACNAQAFYKEGLYYNIINIALKSQWDTYEQNKGHFKTKKTLHICIVTDIKCKVHFIWILHHTAPCELFVKRTTVCAQRGGQDDLKNVMILS